MERSKKSIICNLEKLINKYGYDKVRLTINKYFELQREKKSNEEEIRKAEENLRKLKGKLK